MVEHHLAKVGVAGSNPVSRSLFSFGRRSQVAKAEVCKTSIHRFDSDRRLFSIHAGVAKLADARDLKSLGHFMTVPVRVRPSASLSYLPASPAIILYY